MYDYVWLCVTMYGYVWLYVTMYDYVWIFMAMYDNVRLCMTMRDYVWHQTKQLLQNKFFNMMLTLKSDKMTAVWTNDS